MDGQTEKELIGCFRTGSKSERDAAFEELYEQLGPGLAQVCRRMFRSSADADDAFQETALAIHSALSSFQGKSRLATWAYRIAVRTCLHGKRMQRRAESHGLDVAPVAKPDRSSEESELARRFDQAVASLRQSYRTVFSLCCIDELSQTDVASILGIPEGTVWTRLHRARKELAEMLKDVL